MGLQAARVGGAAQSSKGTGFKIKNPRASFHRLSGQFTVLSLSLSSDRTGKIIPRFQGYWED